jgi:hypothetical protein
MESWTFANNVYTFEFDSRQAKDAKVQITVNVGATDKVGNVSTGASQLLYLDNYPPLIDLDPANIRTKNNPPGEVKCSNSFDPVGFDAKDDLELVPAAGIFRAIVEDQTNHADGVPIVHLANTDPMRVKLYVGANNGMPLLIDKDMDGICDEVAEVESTRAVALSPVQKAGVPWYQVDDIVSPAVNSNICKTENGSDPLSLCDGHSDMWQVIQEEDTGTPLVYAVSPTAGIECTGVAWEFGGKLSADGWVCVATRAVDKVGNVGVSRPIRICMDDPDRAGTPPCANSSEPEPPPSCTDGCAPPPPWVGGLWLWK